MSEPNQNDLNAGSSPPDDAERAAILTLLKATDVGAATVRRLIDTFGTAHAALGADDDTLERVGGLKRESLETLRSAEAEGFGERELSRAVTLGARILTPADGEYPQLLKQIHNPPAALYVLGENLPKGDRAVAVVGSRRASEPGIEVAHQIGAGLSQAGLHVISGLAYGIDAAAHRGALQERGNTVAVLGSGVDTVYPPRHRKVYDSIVRSGAVISELFLGAGPESRNFPMRNRIISGIAAATVVVEAAARSGSLITASEALNENRAVFAVPGHPLSRNYEGCNYLLRQGATLVRHAGDILEDLAPQFGLPAPGQGQFGLPLGGEPEDLDEIELRVWKALDRVEARHADEIAEELKVDASRLGVALMQLEMRGLIQRLPGDRYRRLGSK
ncbi:MAG: DNA-processing protein DprA [bacterium]